MVARNGVAYTQEGVETSLSFTFDHVSIFYLLVSQEPLHDLALENYFGF